VLSLQVFGLFSFFVLKGELSVKIKLFAAVLLGAFTFLNLSFGFNHEVKAQSEGELEELEELNEVTEELNNLLLQLEDLGNLNLQLAESHYEDGNSFFQEEDFNAAIAEYDRAIELNPEYAEAYTNRGVAKAQLGDRNGAIADLQQAAELFKQQGNMSAFQEIQQILGQGQ
jgi:tetratricopeptide (TPR) repeat protein